jgi:hypothetical protein
MSQNKIILISKEDVWKYGHHGMTSASRDIFEEFYKCIRSTFLNQFKEPLIAELIEQIYNIREWERDMFAAYSKAATARTNSIDLRLYKEQKINIPEEQELNNNQLVVINLSDFDKVVYNDFESFFKNANHGYIRTEDGRQYADELWKIFIQDFSIKDLKDQKQQELMDALEWKLRLERALNIYLKNNTILQWHIFLSEFVRHEY